MDLEFPPILYQFLLSSLSEKFTERAVNQKEISNQKERPTISSRSLTFFAFLFLLILKCSILVSIFSDFGKINEKLFYQQFIFLSFFFGFYITILHQFDRLSSFSFLLFFFKKECTFHKFRFETSSLFAMRLSHLIGASMRSLVHRILLFSFIPVWLGDS